MAVTPNSLPISLLINVGVVLSPAAAQTQSLNNLLVLTSDDVIDVTERIRTYASLSAVLADFGSSSPAYLAAVLWFEQSPQPTQLLIGRWAMTATKAKLVGALLSAVQQAIATWNAITTGNFMLPIDGAFLSVSGLNFAASLNLNGVASVIQIALRAAAVTAGVVGAQTATVVWNSTYQQFQIEDGGTGTGTESTIGFATAPTSTGFVQFTGQPANGNTITLNGTAVTFNSGGPDPTKVTIGASVAATIANLVTFLQASVDVQLLKFNYSSGTTIAAPSYLYIKAATAGAGGDALTLARVGANMTLSGATLSGGTGVDVSDNLLMRSTDSGAYAVNGIAAESALTAAGIFDNYFGQKWYGLDIPEALDSDHIAVAGFIQGTNTKHIYFLTTQEGGVLTSSSTTDIAYVLQQLGYTRTFVQYSSSNAYAVASAAAKLLSVDYDGSNTTITLMYKQEPGIVAEQLNQTQAAALQAKNCNVFIAYNNSTAILQTGIMVGGENIWADVITDTDWLAVTIQTALYNVLYTSQTKIPQTDDGMHVLKTAIENVCSQGVANGTLGPGTWTVGGFGTLHQDDFMPTGFYVYQPPISTQNPSARAARQSVPFQVAAKLAGAVHNVQVTINVNQ